MAKTKRSPQQILAEFARKSRYDPLLFAETAWPWGKKGTALEKDDLRVWQADILDEIAQHLRNPETRHDPLRIAVASGHGIGKSACMGIVSTWALSCFMDPRIVVTANTEGQLRTKTSPEIGQWVRSSAYGHLFDIDTMKISLRESPEQHRLDFTPWSETNPEAFQGLHAHGRIVLVMMDEGSAIPQVIWDTVIGAMTDEDTVLIWLVFGNPTQAAGPFRDCFRKHRRLWKTRNIDSRTVEGTNKKYLDDLVATYGEDSDIVKVRVRGLFPSTSNRQFIGENLIDEAMSRQLRKGQYEWAPTILTVDPAWTGEDELVIGMRQGLYFEILETLPYNNNDIEVGRLVANLEVKHRADAVFIDMGYGTGIASYGRDIGRNWRLINFGGKPTREGFLNKRAEMYDDTRTWLMEGGTLPADDKLREDLMGVQTKPHPAGMIQLISKEDVRRQGIPSPDRADALALSFAEPVAKRTHPLTSNLRHERASGGHRPYTDFHPWD